MRAISKMIIVGISIVLIVGSSSVATFADDCEEYGISPICPEEYLEQETIKIDDASIPKNDNKHTHNVAIKGAYEFKGSALVNPVYTEKWLTGKTHYKIVIHNTGEYPLTVKAKRRLKTYATTKIAAGKKATVEFSDIKKTTKFYIYFNGSSFYGSVD